ncbi:hypothetical protein LTR95_011357 [Oleoguttula sp. CCFEE 5521]
MFVLPPPPRYPNGQLYTGAPGGALLETNNILKHPTGPEYQLVVGEGTYHLRDDLLLATPPPHPSDAPQPNNNPLATTVAPATAGTKLSTVVLSSRKPPSHNLFRTITSQSARSNNIQSIQEETQSPKSDAGSMSNGFGSSAYYNGTPSFGDSNPALAPLPVKGKKKDERSKPKNNIVKSNSSFVSRVIPHETIAKRLADHAPEGVYAFANVNRAFMWLDLTAPDNKTENLTKVLFTKAHATCHDVNKHTQSSAHMDLVLGFNTGDIIWYEPISQKYARLNKNGMINNSPVTSLWWLPNKENYFLASHANGDLVVYDKEKEDADFVAEDASPTENGNGTAPKQPFRVKKSVHSRNQKTNPVAVWHCRPGKITCTAFSPDAVHLAIVTDTGVLTILDYISERVVFSTRSYYGGFNTTTWSPDGRYVLTGGQDDLVSIWSFAEQAIVARCVGHESWVRDVKFDPWRCDERNYRFGSVGDDCRLLLWDFSVGMLGRPKAMSLRPRGSVAGAPLNREKTTSTVKSSNASTVVEGAPLEGEPQEDVVQVAVQGKASVSTLPPVMSKVVDEHPVAWLGFEEGCIITSCDSAHIREWDRPKEGSQEDNASSAGASAA